MGCFDYECECGGKTCVFRGGQNGGDATVIIEVPLQDGTTVYMKGDYDSYGAVHVGNYKFYPEQFSDYFEGWFSGESQEKMSKCFKATSIWTLSHHEYDEDEYDGGVLPIKFTTCFPVDITYKVKIGTKTVSNCIPVVKKD